MTAADGRPVWLLGFVAGLAAADTAVAAIALVRATDGLAFTATTMALASGIAGTAQAATVIPAGVLADRRGRRGVLLGALLLAACGELVVATAGSAGAFLVGRAVAGIALGGVLSASLGLLRGVGDVATGRPVGTYTAVSAGTALLGALAGGALATADWRGAFLLLAVLCLPAAALVRPLLPAVPRSGSGPVDVAGMLLLAAGVVGLLIGVSQLGPGVAEREVVVPVGLGLALLGGFVLVERRSSHPAFPVRLLAHPLFVGAALVVSTANLVNSGGGQVLSNVWQYVVGLAPVTVSLGEVPNSLLQVVTAVVVGHLLGRRVQPRALAAVGFALGALAFLAMVPVTAAWGYPWYLPTVVLLGVAVGILSTVDVHLFLRLAPDRAVGPVTAAKVCLGHVGASLGMAGSTALVGSLTLAGVSSQADGTFADDDWQAITQYLLTGTTTVPGLDGVPVPSVAEAYAGALRTTAAVMATVVAVAGVAAYVMMRRRSAAVPVEEFLAAG